jgi:hypothetical protein
VDPGFILFVPFSAFYFSAIARERPCGLYLMENRENENRRME